MILISLQIHESAILEVKGSLACILKVQLDNDCQPNIIRSGRSQKEDPLAGNEGLPDVEVTVSSMSFQNGVHESIAIGCHRREFVGLKGALQDLLASSPLRLAALPQNGGHRGLKGLV